MHKYGFPFLSRARRASLDFHLLHPDCRIYSQYFREIGILGKEEEKYHSCSTGSDIAILRLDLYMRRPIVGYLVTVP